MCATGACTQCSQNSLCRVTLGELMMLMTGCYLLDTLGETSSSTLQCFCWGGSADCQDMFPSVSLLPQILLLSQDHSRPGKRQSLPGKCAWAVFMHGLIASTGLQLHLGQGGTEGPKSECIHKYTYAHVSGDHSGRSIGYSTASQWPVLNNEISGSIYPFIFHDSLLVVFLGDSGSME